MLFLRFSGNKDYHLFEIIIMILLDDFIVLLKLIFVKFNLIFLNHIFGNSAILCSQYFKFDLKFRTLFESFHFNCNLIISLYAWDVTQWCAKVEEVNVVSFYSKKNWVFACVFYSKLFYFLMFRKYELFRGNNDAHGLWWVDLRKVWD